MADIRAAGGTLPIARGQVSAQDLAALSRATGNEFAIYRDLNANQLNITEGLPTQSFIPAEDTRLIIHAQPGSQATAVIPSIDDRLALGALGQRSSVIINSEGTFSIRFGLTNATDNPIVPLFPGE